MIIMQEFIAKIIIEFIIIITTAIAIIEFGAVVVTFNAVTINSGNLIIVHSFKRAITKAEFIE